MQASPSSLVAAISAIPKRHPQTHIRLRHRQRTSRCPHQRRAFGISLPFKGVMGQMALPRGVSGNLPKQQGTKARMKEMARTHMTDDFGLLPNTFIRPRNSELPPLFSSEWKQRLKVEWNYLFNPVSGLLGTWTTLRWWKKVDPILKKKIKEPMRLVERTAVARELHRRFYTALAAADREEISELACRGLQMQSFQRLDQRKLAGAPTAKFKIHKYLGITYPQWLKWPLLSLLPFHSTKIILDRVAPLEIGKSNWLRQTVVRLKSRQSLDKGDGKAPVVKDLTEYVVLQKLKVGGKEHPWKLWGTLQPTTRKEIDEMLASKSKSGMTEGIMEKVQAVQSGLI